MADLLEQASAWLGDMQHKHASRTVTYERGALQVEVHATIGRTIFEVDDGFGVLEKFEARDYLVRAADLVLGDPSTELHQSSAMAVRPELGQPDQRARVRVRR